VPKSKFPSQYISHTWFELTVYEYEARHDASSLMILWRCFRSRNVDEALLMEHVSRLPGLQFTIRALARKVDGMSYDSTLWEVL
jgi:hypothetical protein